MRLWRRASGAMKDRGSIAKARLSPGTSLRNPDMEAAVIRATSHDEHRVDYRSSDRVFRWIRTSPGSHLQPCAWALCVRMEKTRDWVVALKGLILMHGVLSCRVPSVQRIGRLPFDLSGFRDGHLPPPRARPLNAFVRAYYAFLDQKSAFYFTFIQHEPSNQQQTKGTKELVRLQKLQILLDMLLQIKPESEQFVRVLILEAMDCVIIEIFDIYSKICSGIARVLPTIDVTNNRSEALISLKVLQKATEQGTNLTNYFEFCRKIGVMNASEKPQVPVIPANEIQELERVVNNYNVVESTKEEDKANVMANDDSNSKKRTMSDFYTIITNEWEVFDEDITVNNNGRAQNQLAVVEPYNAAKSNGKNCQELPDLISFL